MYIVLIIIVVLAVPAILGARLAAAKRREQRIGSPSTFTEPSADADAGAAAQSASHTPDRASGRDPAAGSR